jgi:hypothetical protein
MNNDAAKQGSARALRNGISRARKHLANNRPDLAGNALRSAAATSESWLNGTHYALAKTGK